MSGPRSKDTTLCTTLYETWFGDEPHSYFEDNVIGRGTISETYGHDFENLSSRGPDKGGPFALEKQEYSEESNFYDPSRLDGWIFHFIGGQKAIASSVSPTSDIWPTVHPSTSNELDAMGTKAIAQTEPTSPAFGAMQFLGELREGLPRLGIETFSSRSQRAKSAGSDYLNYEFAWKPLVKDIQNFADAVRSQEKILRQQKRESGKPVKRKQTMLDTTTSEVYDLGGAKPSPGLNFWIPVIEGQLTQTITIKHRIWFSGCYTFYLPPEKSGEENRKLWLKKADRLFGIKLTPEVLWDLSPWSWALDWFGNAGDVLHNLKFLSQDGPVLRYGYIMEQKSVTHSYLLSGVQYPGDSSWPGLPGTFDFRQDFTTVVKSRRPATPFGFGLLPITGFTPRQWAITSALGLSKGAKRP